MYAAQDWAFDRSLIAMLHGQPGNGQNKEKREIGEKPDMWEVGLEVDNKEKEGLLGLGGTNGEDFREWQVS